MQREKYGGFSQCAEVNREMHTGDFPRTGIRITGPAHGEFSQCNIIYYHIPSKNYSPRIRRQQNGGPGIGGENCRERGIDDYNGI